MVEDTITAGNLVDKFSTLPPRAMHDRTYFMDFAPHLMSYMVLRMPPSMLQDICDGLMSLQLCFMPRSKDPDEITMAINTQYIRKSNLVLAPGTPQSKGFILQFKIPLETVAKARQDNDPRVREEKHKKINILRRKLRKEKYRQRNG